MFAIYASDMKTSLRHVFDKQFRLWAGGAFMALALIAIQYEEVIAPTLGEISQGLDAMAADFGKKLTSFTL